MYVIKTMVTGIGFLYNDFIACIDKIEDKFAFVWKHWDSNLLCNLPIIFWTDDVDLLIQFLKYSDCEFSEQDEIELRSEDCIPVNLIYDNNELWIG